MEQSLLFKYILINDHKNVVLTLKDKSFNRPSLARLRDATGNSILHIAVNRQCDPEIILLLLDFVSPAIRNEDGLQMQDLFLESPKKLEYQNALQQFIVSKINDGDSHIVTAWVLQGWFFKPVMQKVVEELYDVVNEDLDRFLEDLCTLSNKVQELHHSAVRGDVEILRELLSSQRSQQEKERLITACDGTGETVLHKLVICEQEFILKELLSKFPDSVNITDHMDRTPLHLAAALENPHCNLYEILESCGASPAVRDIKDLKPMDYRSKKSLIDIRKLKRSVLSSIVYSRNENDAVSYKSQENSHIPNFDTAESQYIQEALSEPLIRALATVVEKRPVDPIEFLATYLIRHNTLAQKNDSEDKSTLSKNQKIVVRQTEQESTTAQEKQYTISPELFNLDRIEERDCNGRTKIHEHVLRGGVHFFGLVAENCNFALRDKDGKTAKHLALELNMQDAAKELDALVYNIINEENTAALELLISLGYSDCFPNIAEEYGPDLFGMHENITKLFYDLPNITNKIEQVRISLQQNETQEKFEELIANKSVAMAFDQKGLSLIHRTLLARNLSAMRNLLKAHPDCGQLPDYLNRLPIHYVEALGGQIRQEYFEITFGFGKDSLDALGNKPFYYRNHPDDILR